MRQVMDFEGARDGELSKIAAAVTMSANYRAGVHISLVGIRPY